MFTTGNFLEWIYFSERSWRFIVSKEIYEGGQWYNWLMFIPWSGQPLYVSRPLYVAEKPQLPWGDPINLELKAQEQNTVDLEEITSIK